MKKFFLFVGIFFVVMLAACSSAEGDEVLEYHNGFVDNINDRGSEIEQLNQKMDEAATDEEVYEISENEIIPVIDEMKGYMDKQDPETDVVKEYHQLRMDWFNTWSEGYYLENEALDKYISQSASEDETDELMNQSIDKFTEAATLNEKADQRAEELIEEYNFEKEEE